MKQIASSALDLVGHTPLVELQRLTAEFSLQARLLAKVESFNPAGSVKDRIATAMITAAERDGQLEKGSTIVEATSGNTGVGLAFAAAVKGYRAIIVMPDTMSVERRRLVAAYGAEVVLTPGAEGMKGAIAKAEQLTRDIPNAMTLGQFVNPANPAAHYATTGEEIWQDTAGEIDLFVAGVGTGGTVSGVGRRLKEHRSTIRIVAVEPATSPVLSGGRPGAHRIQGIGAGFVPATYSTEIVDEIMQVNDEEATTAARLAARHEGLLCGISSGAALHAALQLAQKTEYAGKTMVVLLPDTGERYLSTTLYGE